MQRLDALLQRYHLHQEIEFLIGPRRFLGTIQQTQALLKKPLLIKDMGIVERFVQLQIDAVGTF